MHRNRDSYISIGNCVESLRGSFSKVFSLSISALIMQRRSYRLREAICTV